jgi:hypothetical protein
MGENQNHFTERERLNPQNDLMLQQQYAYNAGVE